MLVGRRRHPVPGSSPIPRTRQAGGFLEQVPRVGRPPGGRRQNGDVEEEQRAGGGSLRAGRASTAPEPRGATGQAVDEFIRNALAWHRARQWPLSQQAPQYHQMGKHSQGYAQPSLAIEARAAERWTFCARLPPLALLNGRPYASWSRFG
jgi:hypothetical protein